MKCQKCGQEAFIPFQCPYCGDQFCSAHRLPENHDCPRMDLARARRSEGGAFVQGPNSYEYRVTFGQPRQAKRHVYFSPKELKHLTIAALLVVGVGLSYVLFGGIFAAMDWTLLSGFAVILTASFLTHEIAHKVIAQKKGLWAEFRLTLWGAALTLISVISPLFKLISPGAVMISGPARGDEIVKISLAGPTVNIAFSTAFLAAALAFTGATLNPVQGLLLLAAFLNAFIALFNLIPMGILDGYKIFRWDKKLWTVAFTPSLILTIITYILVQPYFYAI
jgi:Zn-dependent protease